MPKVKDNKTKARNGKAKGKVIPQPVHAPGGVRAEVCEGESAMTADRMRAILGWEEESGEDKFGKDYLFTYGPDTKVRLTRNKHNRVFDLQTGQRYCQDTLNRCWADSRNGEGDTMNGESFILSRSGEVLSGQHRGYGLVVADWEWREGLNKHHWRELWPDGPPTMEMVLVTGVSDNPRVVRTLDNVRPRTLADVLYTDKTTFGDLDRAERDRLCGVLDHAIRLVWQRTGRGDTDLNPFHAHRTHSESLDFLDNHPRLREAAKHLWGENLKGAVARFMSPGYAAGLLYLMGMSATPPGSGYYEATPPSQSLLDEGEWDKAVEFWRELLSKGQTLAPVRLARRPVEGDSRGGDWSGYVFAKGGDGGTLAERLAVLCRAWTLYRTGDKITIESLALRYNTDWTDDGRLDSARLVECPTCGGIDRGNPKLNPKEDGDGDVSGDEVEAGKDRESPTPPQQTVSTSLTEQLRALRGRYQGRILIFKLAATYVAWEADARTCASVLGGRLNTKDGLPHYQFPEGDLERAKALLFKAGYKPALCVKTADGIMVNDCDPPRNDRDPSRVEAHPGRDANNRPLKKSGLRGGTGK